MPEMPDPPDKKEDQEQLPEQELGLVQIPDFLPVLPLRDIVIFPFMIVPLYVSRDKSIKAVDSALAGRPWTVAPAPGSAGWAAAILDLLAREGAGVRAL